MLIQKFLECDLLNILIELSGLEDDDVSLPAQKYVKLLTNLM